jgi:putative transposase
VDDERRERWARFRFEVIAELLDKNLDRAERARLRQAILSRTYTRPDGTSWKIARRTLNSWLSRYEKGQLKGLENRQDKRLGQMKALDEELLTKAQTLRLAMPSRSIEDIRLHLKYVKKVDISKVSASTLNRHLNRIGAVKDKNYSERGSFQNFQKAHINQLWQSDLTDGIYLPDPTGMKEVRQTTLITYIDDASRFCVHGQFYWREDLESLLNCYRTAILGRGRPTTLYSDNGSVYRSNDFGQICRELGITLKHSEKQRPEGKGKQERHYLTLQMRFYKEAKKSGLETIDELNEFFWAWLDECYHKVKHKGTGMTPLERWQMEEEIIERVSFEEIQAAMQLRTRRMVETKTALIKLNGKRYQASRNLAGQRVQVRWPFDDQSHINVFRNGEFVERAELFVLENDIDYSKRPVRGVKAGEPKVLECSKQFRAALVARFLQKEVTADTSRYGVLSEREFVYVVGQCLDRSLHESENEALSVAYKQLFPMDAEFVERALLRAQASKGRQMHIGFYVKSMQEFKVQTR